MTSPHTFPPSHDRCAAPGPRPALEPLEGVWRGDGWQQAMAQRVQPSGHPLLDAQLPGGGWPLGAMTELLQPAHSHAEWPLLLPGLAALMQRCAGQVVLVAAPFRPFLPSLAAAGIDAQRLCCVDAQGPADANGLAWACEQALRCRDVLAVLAWLPAMPVAALRRLQWAAAAQGRTLWLWREASAALQASATPAPLRLRVQMVQGRQGVGDGAACLRVQLLKRRGPLLEQPLMLALPHWAWQPVLQAQMQRRQQQTEQAQRWLHGRTQALPAVAAQAAAAPLNMG